MCILCLGLEDITVERAARVKSYRDDKPGLVKIRLPSVTDKVNVLRHKRVLQSGAYRRVFIRSPQSHTDRLIQHNIQTLLKELPNGDQYRGGVYQDLNSKI